MNIFCGNHPDHVHSHAKIFMNNNIPHPGKLTPGNIWLFFSNFFRKMFYGFPDNFKPSQPDELSGLCFLHFCKTLLLTPHQETAVYVQYSVLYPEDKRQVFSCS